MDTLSNSILRFDYFGKSMPIEFEKVCKEPDFQWHIKKRKSYVFRFYKTIEGYLKDHGIPSLYHYAVKHKYPKYIQDLYYMNEIGYINSHEEEYDNMFKNKSFAEQRKRFVSADYGGKSIFELEQDVKASSIFEDIVADHSFGALKPNPQASGRESDVVNTYCDFIYETPETFTGQHVVIPVELKTKWSSSDKVEIRGSAKKIIESKGIILAIFIKDNKYVLIDSADKNVIFKPGHMYGGKDCEYVNISESDKKDLEIWNPESMKNMLNNIYLLYKKRGQ